MDFVFFFTIPKILLHCLLASSVSDKKSNVILDSVSSEYNQSFSLENVWIKKNSGVLKIHNDILCLDPSLFTLLSSSFQFQETILYFLLAKSPACILCSPFTVLPIIQMWNFELIMKISIIVLSCFTSLYLKFSFWQVSLNLSSIPFDIFYSVYLILTLSFNSLLFSLSFIIYIFCGENNFSCNLRILNADFNFFQLSPLSYCP